jgi:formylglycine-generating enzyme required for sulfatase activity
MRKLIAIACVAAAAASTSGCFSLVPIRPYSDISSVRDIGALRAQYARAAGMSSLGWDLRMHGQVAQAEYLDAVWRQILVVERDRARQKTAASAPASDAGRAAAAAPAATDVAWVRFLGGEFTMGRAADANARPRRRVWIAPFEMSKTLVTVAQYGACVDAGVCAEPPTGGQCHWRVPGRERFPINCVDWNEAQKFAQWAGARLPAEAEWEYAARSGGRDQAYPWGDGPPTCDKVVGKGKCPNAGSMPVCAKPAGDTRQGLCDMGGYVDEWVQDWYHDSYAGAPGDGTPWEEPEGTERVVRGADMRADRRSSFFPSSGQFSIGFRLAR